MTFVDKPFSDFQMKGYDPKKQEECMISLSDFKGKWLVLFFYPKDFTFVCPTEIADLTHRAVDFQKLGAEVVIVSTDTAHTHKAWIETEEMLAGTSWLMGADHNGRVSHSLGIYDPDEGIAQRGTFIVDPDGMLRSAEVVSDSIGRNASEIIRQIKALKFVRDNPGRVCPASWDEGALTLEPNIKKAGKVSQDMK
jgi:peroxiredoxin (alkyl hydroperoxide reductase subunit C)